MTKLRRILPNLLLSAATISLIGVPAYAMEPPAVLQGVPGVTYEGEIGGMHAWSRDGDEMLWLQTEDGAHVMAGVLFNSRGIDMGAAIHGRIGMNIEDLIASAPGDHDQIAAAATDEMETAVTTAAENLVSTIGNGTTDASGVYLDAQDALSALPQEARTQALITLVQTIDAAGSQEEFNRAVADWQQLVADLVRDNTGASIAGRPDGSTITTSESTTVAPADRIMNANGERFVDMLAFQTFWFSVGTIGAPTVYAVIDPTCPFCARAMKSLKGDVEAGRIELRIILAPLISSQAPDVIAGILSQSEPVSAFWEHEMDIAAGGSGVDPVAFASLPEDYQAVIRTNYDVAVESGLPGVPYFIYENEAGEQRFSGVPQAGQFQDALPLPE